MCAHTHRPWKDIDAVRRFSRIHNKLFHTAVNGWDYQYLLKPLYIVILFEKPNSKYKKKWQMNSGMLKFVLTVFLVLRNSVAWSTEIDLHMNPFLGGGGGSHYFNGNNLSYKHVTVACVNMEITGLVK